MLRVGTRGSTLALAQARWVADRLGADVELVTVTVAGITSATNPNDQYTPVMWNQYLNMTTIEALAQLKPV